MTGPEHTAKTGFTLVEMIVVAIILVTLAGVLTPIVVSQLEKARLARARQDCRAIAAAIGAFHRDLGALPARGPHGAWGRIRVLVSGRHLAAAPLPAGGGAFTGGPRDLLVNHLTVNRPGGRRGGYPTRGMKAWRGPYLDASSLDPWGRAYVVNIGAALARGQRDRCCWVLSAGPDGRIQTRASDDAGRTRGDDIGCLIQRR